MQVVRVRVGGGGERARLVDDAELVRVVEAARGHALDDLRGDGRRVVVAGDDAEDRVVAPGVDLQRFQPPATGEEQTVRQRARRELGLPEQGFLVSFVGRVQPLKGPDVLLRATADLLARQPQLADQLTVAVVGGPSGSGLDRPQALIELAASLGITAQVRFLPPQHGSGLTAVYHASDLVAVPSFSESFGLVALEAQACGTPVVAAAVGGLLTTVRDQVSGVLLDTHDPQEWARALDALLAAADLRAELGRGAVTHAAQFSWDRTAEQLLTVYREAVARNRIRQAAQLVSANQRMGW